jgi:hypothetical protein
MKRALILALSLFFGIILISFSESFVFYVPHARAEDITVDLDLPKVWSMISLPVLPADLMLSEIFPGAVVVYYYKKYAGYVRVKNNEKLKVGDGYWILLNESQIYTLTGQPIHEHTFQISEDGWVMMGGDVNVLLRLT